MTDIHVFHLTSAAKLFHETIIAFSLLLSSAYGVGGISCPHGVACEDYASRALATESITRHEAIINVTCHEPKSSGSIRIDWFIEGTYWHTSRISDEYGIVVHVKLTALRDSTKCGVGSIDLVAGQERWVALMDKDVCRGEGLQAAFNAVRGASAVMLYSDEGEIEPFSRLLHEAARKNFKVDDTVFVNIQRTAGERIARLIDNGTHIHVNISVGKAQVIMLNGGINRTSMLFLSISFIVLMIISMAWLVFYYVQRSRHSYAKQRFSRRMISAAKKAITRMPLKTVRSGEEHLEPGFDLCAICIEGYRSSDVARILPCKHVFHKHCIDPWLLEQRNCPICKIDILKAFGLQVCRSRESGLNVDNEIGSASYAYSDFGALDSGRDFDSDGVEIVRFQLAQIECHTPANAGSTAAISRSVPRCGSLSDDIESQITANDTPLTGRRSCYTKSCDEINSAAALAGSVESIPSGRGQNQKKCHYSSSSITDDDSGRSDAGKPTRGSTAVCHQASVHRVPSYRGRVAAQGSMEGVDCGGAEVQPLMNCDLGREGKAGSSTSID